MKGNVLKYVLLIIGTSLLLLSGVSAVPAGTAAAPRLAITDTVEPPTRTSTPAPTNTPITSAATPRPTATHTPSKPDLADPAVAKFASVTEVKIGDQITFTIRVTNNGPHTAHDVVVTDPIADYLDVIEATTTRGAVSSNGRTVIVTIGDVPTGDEVIIIIRVRVNERAAPPGGQNNVILTTSSPGDNPGNNSSIVTFRIPGPPQPTAPVLSPTATILAVATATPLPPVILPPTGAAEDTNSRAVLFVALGTAALLLSLAFHDRTRE